MKPLRIVFLVVGSVLALFGLALLAGGGALGWALATQRDHAGYFTSANERFRTPTYAITTQEIDLGKPGPSWWANRKVATVRVRGESAHGAPLFIGIGPQASVERYLAHVPHDEITDVSTDPFAATYRRHNAGASGLPTSPRLQTFWVARSSGTATRTLTWSLRSGHWAVVVMNANGQRPVAADLDIGVKVKYLEPLAFGLGGAGLLFLIIGVGMIIGGVIGGTRETEPMVGAGAVGAGPPALSPVQLAGRLDPTLSRWQWLVKWFLAIPHYIVLLFLWIAFGVLTVVAWFAILFTGRYPRSIFDFNVGVLRWNWRVQYYATGVLGTDQYPPFSLAATDYPATLDIAYPEQLSRGLVLVKSWLLAIPHLLIVGALTGAASSRDGLGLSLLGLLVAIAAFTLLFRNRYPKGIFDFLLGIHRWAYRVLAYVALMTDEYPPFRLDQGPEEPTVP